MTLAELMDMAVSLATLLGLLAAPAGTVWLLFRRRLQTWWAPYRTGLQAMAEVPALRRSVDASRHELQEVRSSLNLLTLQVRARGDANDDTGEFECAQSGENTYVNQTYARWLGVGKVELLGWGWINFIHPEDRERVRREWDSCRSEHRVYRMRHRMVTADREVFEVEVTATPIPEAPPAQRWIGVIRRVG